MTNKKVLVTGIGGNVGQGVIRNIRNTKFDIVVIGTNVDSFSAGNHLCDSFYQVPYAYSENYITEIIKIVDIEDVDLIIPTTDYEVYYLSKFKSDINCKIAVSGHQTSSVFLDKYLTYEMFKNKQIPFSDSFLPSKYNNSYEDVIVKPRKGRGSRGIKINPKSLEIYKDDEYMVQEFHKGVEITTAFYVTQSNKLHGFITFDRILENGTTTRCRVVSNYDSRIKELLETIIKYSNIRGAANIQAIVNKKGEIVPFEVNCRISGTNSIRANFGFEDVKYTLEEWLYDSEISLPNIKKGVATRILMDVIYPEAENFDGLNTNLAKHYIY